MSENLLLTPEAYERLKQELADLIIIGRPDIAKRIQEAREEGDLKENGGYHAAKEEQGKIESRINRLGNILALAEIGEADATDGIVKQGLLVTCTLNGKETEFYLGSQELFEGTKHQDKIDEGEFNVYSPDSPIGRVISGKKVGVTVSYKTPNGKEISVEITKIANFAF
jgi:transcription elongation factor GreA